MTQQNPFDKILPEDYVQHAIVSETAGDELIARLDVVAMQPRRIVDCGCGPGDLTSLLQQRFPDAEIFAIDSAKNMLDYAKNKHGETIHWVLTEANQLPFADHSVDLLVANELLPWCAELETVLHEWRRVLRPDGLLVFTSLGPDTLRELPLEDLQLLHLIDMHHLGDALIQAGFQDPIMDVETFTLTYKEPANMQSELQAMGLIHAPLNASVLSATVEVVFGHAWGPQSAEGFTADDAGVVKIPLSHLRRRIER